MATLILLLILLCVGMALIWARRRPKIITGANEPCATIDDWARVNRDKFELNNPALKNKTIYVYYYAPWCGYCKLFQPVWNEVIAMTNIHFVSVNRDDGKIPSIKYVPCILRLNSNGTTEVYEGEKTKEQLVVWINSA